MRGEIVLRFVPVLSRIWTGMPLVWAQSGTASAADQRAVLPPDLADYGTRRGLTEGPGVIFGRRPDIPGDVGADQPCHRRRSRVRRVPTPGSCRGRDRPVFPVPRVWPEAVHTDCNEILSLSPKLFRTGKSPPEPMTARPTAGLPAGDHTDESAASWSALRSGARVAAEIIR